MAECMWQLILHRSVITAELRLRKAEKAVKVCVGHGDCLECVTRNAGSSSRPIWWDAGYVYACSEARILIDTHF